MELGIKDTATAVLSEKKYVPLSAFLVGSSLVVARLGFPPESSIWFPFRRPGPPWTPTLSHTGG